MSVAEMLSKIWLFSSIDPDHLEKLATFTFTKEFKPGEIVVEGATRPTGSASSRRVTLRS